MKFKIIKRRFGDPISIDFLELLTGVMAPMSLLSRDIVTLENYIELIPRPALDESGGKNSIIYIRVKDEIRDQTDQERIWTQQNLSRRTIPVQ